jgi:phenylalanyl-tRNA synthetase alpha subunit
LGDLRGIVTDIIDEVIGKVGLERVPWSYVLLKPDGKLSDEQETRFKQRNMITIESSFEEFFEELDKEHIEAVSEQKPSSKSIKIGIEGRSVYVDRREIDLISEFYEVLNDDLVSVEHVNKDDQSFFKGSIGKYGSVNSSGLKEVC